VLELMFYAVYGGNDYRRTLALLDQRRQNTGSEAEGGLADIEADCLIRIANERIREDADPGLTQALLDKAASCSPLLRGLVLMMGALLGEYGEPEVVIHIAMQALAEYDKLPSELPELIGQNYPEDFRSRVYEMIAVQFDRMPQQDLSADRYRQLAAAMRRGKE
jgi:hypothetical protein